MNFLNPLLLIGLLAASLPIIIHLINRRRAVRRRFPAIEFLLRSQKKLARRLKVRQWLLLAMRVAALMLVPLAMARPYLISDQGEGEGERLPSGIVFVVDDSASMGAGGRWNKAVEAVEARLDRTRPWDRLGLVFAGAWPDGTPLGEDDAILELSDDPGEVREVMARHTPSERATDVVAGLRAASEVLSGVDLPHKEIVLVTDLQKSGLKLSELPVGGLGVPVKVVDVRGEAEVGNLAVVEATYEQKSAGARPEFEITAVVRNHGTEAARGVEVRLEIDGQQVAAGLVDIEPGESASKSFIHTFDSKGLHRAALRLADGADEHPADNVRHLPIHLAQKVKVLLVNGDPRSVPYQDELFYLERALRPSARSTSTLTTEITGVEGLAAHPFKDYDVVALANVEKIPRASVAQLTSFVEAGGGLLFIMGRNVKPEAYNDLFGALLPKPLRSVKLLTTREDPDAPVKLARLGKLDRSHPVFKVFDLPGGETVHSVPVYSYMLLEPAPQDDTRILMSYGDGAPALLERQLGQGRVAMLTTTVDRDWTDLPIRTAFLPLMRRLTTWLARRSTSGHSASQVVGARVRLDVQAQDRARVEVRDPDGGRIVLTPEGTEDDALLSFVPRRTGHYQVVVSPDVPGAEPRELDELAFAVNIDPSEADLTPMPSEELLTALSGGGNGGAGGQAEVVPDTPERRVGVWSMLLFFVTLVLLGETILGTRRSVLLKLWGLLRGRRAEDALS